MLRVFKVGCIIQARMGSTRLPGKVLKKIGDDTVLEYMIKRVQLSKRTDLIVVATSTNKADDQIVNLCKKIGVEVFRGCENMEAEDIIWLLLNLIYKLLLDYI